MKDGYYVGIDRKEKDQGKIIFELVKNRWWEIGIRYPVDKPEIIAGPFSIEDILKLNEDNKPKNKKGFSL